ncbi:MAG TPA: sugar phosphate isomerase/epimerase family protein [Candidatus Acidoferrum sp.]|jgi:sugar phosphate isomerase/epimerase|nr:sugar phosphate isomerase/epimerase family protein [Candidatus Acidoferrum sp.]
MQRVLSTYRYIRHPLNAPLLAEISRSGVRHIEIFCATPHFTYAEPQVIRDLAGSLGEYGLTLHSLHAPTQRDLAPGRESGFPISISDAERVRRLDAVDEVKRALEVAERIPFKYLVQHIGHGRQAADSRSFDAAFNSLEHLVVFAKQRGVTVALENTPGEFGCPASLQQFIKETHLGGLRYCFDIGHAHIEGGVAPALEMMQGRIVTTHLHDNHGEKDEHLLPGEGGIDWDAAVASLRAAPEELPFVLELKEKPAGGPSLDDVRSAFDKLEETAERVAAGRS